MTMSEHDFVLIEQCGSRALYVKFLVQRWEEGCDPSVTKLFMTRDTVTRRVLYYGQDEALARSKL
jgi:hypothetical protein